MGARRRLTVRVNGTEAGPDRETRNFPFLIHRHFWVKAGKMRFLWYDMTKARFTVLSFGLSLDFHQTLYQESRWPITGGVSGGII